MKIQKGFNEADKPRARERFERTMTALFQVPKTAIARGKKVKKKGKS